MKTAIALVFLLLVMCCAPVACAVTFDWATVSNPGNADDTHGDGYGRVEYSYRISKHEVTNAQYTEFLNAVAATDTYGLYSIAMGSSTMGGIIRSGFSGNYRYAVKPDAIGQGPGGADGDDYSYGNKPVVYVSFFDAMRLVNWLENGQPTGTQGLGTTEDGVYTISDGVSEVRSTGATFFIPSEDEWYKAAYHKNDGVTGNYWDYPMSSNLADHGLPSSDTGQSANFGVAFTTGISPYPMTDVGAYTQSESPYGTFDQGGNVREWNEAIIGSIVRGVRGGDWFFGSDELRAGIRGFYLFPTTFERSHVGFRVASHIPEPSTLLLSTLAAVGLLVRRR